jgi:hypothetical protein
LNGATSAYPAERFGQRLVRLEMDDGGATAAGVVLELAQDPPADAQAAGLRSDPHALDVEGHVAVELERSAADRLAVQARDEQQPGRLGEVLGGGRDRAGQIEAGVETRVELGVVGLQAEAPRGRARVLDRDVDEPRGQQALDDAHRLDEPCALVVAQWRQKRLRELVAAAIDQRPLGPPRGGQADGPHALVRPI